MENIKQKVFNVSNCFTLLKRKIACLAFLVVPLNYSPTNAMERILGGQAPVLPVTLFQAKSRVDPVQWDSSCRKIVSQKKHYGKSDDEAYSYLIAAIEVSKPTDKICEYRLVSKKWAEAINKSDLLRYYIKLSPGEMKKLPLTCCVIKTSLNFLYFNDSNIGQLFKLLHCTSDRPVDVFSWNGSGLGRKDPVQSISKKSINSVLKLMTYHFDLNQLKELHFSKINFKDMSQKFAKFLVKLPGLQHLTVGHSGMEGDEITTIIKALPKSLVSVSFLDNESGSAVFDALLGKLPELENLKRLCIQVGKRSTAETLYLRSNLYGINPYNPVRKSYDPMGEYRGGQFEHSRRVISVKDRILNNNQLDCFKKTVESRKDLEYLILD